MRFKDNEEDTNMYDDTFRSNEELESLLKYSKLNCTVWKIVVALELAYIFLTSW